MDYNFPNFFGFETIILRGEGKNVTSGNMLFLPVILSDLLQRPRPFVLHPVLTSDDFFCLFSTLPFTYPFWTIFRYSGLCRLDTML